MKVIILSLILNVSFVDALKVARVEVDNFHKCVARHGTVSENLLRTFVGKKPVKVLAARIMSGNPQIDSKSNTSYLSRWDYIGPIEEAWQKELPEFAYIYSSDRMPKESRYQEMNVFVPHGISNLVGRDWPQEQMLQYIASLGGGNVSGQHTNFLQLYHSAEQKQENFRKLYQGTKYSNGDWLLAQVRTLTTLLFVTDCLQPDWMLRIDDDTVIHPPAYINKVKEYNSKDRILMGSKGCEAVDLDTGKRIISLCGGNGHAYSNGLAQSILADRSAAAKYVHRSYSQLFRSDETDPHGVNDDAFMTKISLNYLSPDKFIPFSESEHEMKSRASFVNQVEAFKLKFRTQDS